MSISITRSWYGCAAAALTLSAISAIAISSVTAAPQATPPSFEVASVKQDPNGQHIRFIRPFPTLRIEGATLKDLILFAYEVHVFQVTGGPAWIDSELYDIDAKAERPPTSTREFVDLQKRRLQTLLADRFHLVLHRETKELPVYEMTVTKGGAKLPVANCLQRITGDTATAPGKTAADYCGGLGGSMGSGRLEGNGVDMSFLGGVLSSMLSRTVADKTGLAGQYIIHLTFAPESPAGPSPDPAPPRPMDASADTRPDILTAIQEQLGLKLESAKGPVPVLVIDRVEKPTGN